MTNLTINATRLLHELHHLATLTDCPTTTDPTLPAPTTAVTRIVFTPRDLEARAYIKSLAEAAGFTLRVDAIGNTFIRFPGTDPTLPAIGTGSHTDAIPHAGMYDGTVGVLGGLEAMRSLKESGFTPTRSIETLMLTSEEPTRFGIGCIGSRLLGGSISPTTADALPDRLSETDMATPSSPTASSSAKVGSQDAPTTLHDVRTAANFTGSLTTVPLPPNYYHAWVELHIEQGPLLEREGIPIGIVTNIAAPASYRYEITGFGGHAGALLMPDRRDALSAAAELILSVEKHTLAANARAGAPSEIIQTTAEAEATYDRHVGVSRNYAHVKIRISPNNPGTGYEFSNDVPGKALPKKFIHSIDEGIHEAMLGGVLAGHALVDIKVSLTDASYHEADSNEMSFRIAASQAFKEAARKAKPVLMPPASSGVDSVATVGTLAVHPGAINSVPSRVTLTLDIRDTDVARREAIMSALHADIAEIESRRHVTITEHQINADLPAISDPHILATLESICTSNSIPYKKMVARAYHDTSFIAPIAPVAMIFIPCRNGVSHRPDEYATPESIALGTRVLALALAHLAQEGYPS